jgi:poly(A) polymerase
VLNTQTDALAIQRKIGADMRDIWAMQPRFEKAGWQNAVQNA